MQLLDDILECESLKRKIKDRNWRIFQETIKVRRKLDKRKVRIPRVRYKVVSVE